MDGSAARKALLLFSVLCVRDSSAVQSTMRREECFYFGRGCSALDGHRLPIKLMPDNLGLRRTLLGRQSTHGGQQQPA